ncbi:helix-turn-helix transcriptional regulator [Paenibacillus sp. IB182496]|uniref:Helix-turn-helix transcriptional regulator n=1 Tax=Paenibacillus sabuli TaxID=2772509 RepID=A0A927GRY9_9BACL|nr:AraC family transcriptional regulator [Paenibacillus sabuli]MBD2845490.1 helix-turn-helix transcriptional regulator [Paenibacillus sabuli]
MRELLAQLHCRIINVFHRNRDFWQRQPYIISNPTRLLSFVYVYGGEGELELDGARTALEAGCVFQIPYGRHLVLRSEPQRPLCYYTVQYDYTRVVWEGEAAACERPAARILPLPLVMPMPDQAGMRVGMERLYRLWTSKSPGFAGRAQLAFVTLLHHVFDQTSAQREADPAEQAIHASAAYIEQHYADPLEREALARRASLSSSYYSVLFKRHVGCTPVQYITRIRMDSAMQLLKESNLPVSEVARQVGYEDALYFTRVFSRAIGMTPRAFRRG